MRGLRFFTVFISISFVIGLATPVLAAQKPDIYQCSGGDCEPGGSLTYAQCRPNCKKANEKSAVIPGASKSRYTCKAGKCVPGGGTLTGSQCRANCK